MSRRSAAVVCTTLLAVSSLVVAQASKAPKRYAPNPTVSVRSAGSPDTFDPHFHLSLNNDRARVFRVDLTPGESTGITTHQHDYIVVALQACKVKAVGAANRFDLQLADGEMQVLTAGWPHKLVNDSAAPAHLALIEVTRGIAPTRAICGLGARSCSQVKFGKTVEGTYTQTLLFETETVRLLRGELGPHGSLPEHAEVGDHLIVPLTDFRTGDEYNPPINYEAGSAIWRPRHLGSVTNMGAQEARVLILEIK